MRGRAQGRGRRLVLIGTATAIAAAAQVAEPARAAQPGDQSALLLPDLRQQVPASLDVTVVPRRNRYRVRLGFRSGAENVGAGAVDIRGVRGNRKARVMRADQILRRLDGSVVRRSGIGRLRYETVGDHRHWHLDDFMAYELRRARDFRLVRPSNKAGFCLTDRYNLDLFTQMPNEPPRPVFRHECGLGRPHLRTLREGISVGHVDYYDPQLEGQYFDITRLRAGRYWLVHRADPRNILLESDETNNASSILIEVRWRHLRGGARSIRVFTIGRCPGASRCQVPGGR